jgi:hypothetical protein
VFPQKEFGYSRKDVLLIGVGVTLLGYGLKSGLEVTPCFEALLLALPPAGAARFISELKNLTVFSP